VANDDEAGNARLAIRARRDGKMVHVREKPLRDLAHRSFKAALDRPLGQSFVAPLDRDAALGEKKVQNLPERGSIRLDCDFAIGGIEGQLGIASLRMSLANPAKSNDRRQQELAGHGTKAQCRSLTKAKAGPSDYCPGIAGREPPGCEPRRSLTTFRL
jgi:hypothetical protein